MFWFFLYKETRKAVYFGASSVLKIVVGFQLNLRRQENSERPYYRKWGQKKYGELMTKRKSKDQNVEHICHPQKEVKMGGVWEEKGYLLLLIAGSLLPMWS